MPSILNDDEKQTVKRTVPKASNKIHAVAVAKLYVSLPSHQPPRWTYTGLQGALVLANDLVGHTFWLKLVDISPSNRGVLWDMEIYDGFQYHQDRTFFHSFEGEKCMVGLSLLDEKEARQLRKKMDEREKNASKSTKARPFAFAAGGQQQLPGSAHAESGGKHSRFGGLFSSHRSSGSGPAQGGIPPAAAPLAPAGAASSRTSSSGIDLTDPNVQAVLQDLKQMGITEDQIEEHAGFIKSYIEQNKATAAARAAPPPPPPGAAPDLSPQNTGARGPPPPPPPSRRTATGGFAAAVSAVQNQQQAPPSPESSTPPRAPSPPRARFRAPPPIADIGKFANAAPATRDRATSQSAGVPPPPPRPPKTPLDDDIASPQQNFSPSLGSKYSVPPAFDGGKKLPQVSAAVPPPPPTRHNVPPAPPPRDSTTSAAPPPPPPRDSGPPAPPPLPPPSARPVPPAPTSFTTDSAPPPPPPLPPPNTSSAGGPPPPPPPPPMPARNSTSAEPPTPPRLPPPPSAPGEESRGGLLADIRGGARLKKVSDSEKRDRSSAAVPGGQEAAVAAPAGASAGAAEGGLAGALASALAARKSKVQGSDDEKDDDDW